VQEFLNADREPQKPISVSPIHLDEPKSLRLKVIFSVLPGYLIYIIYQLVALPILILRSIRRARKRGYKGVIFHRLFGGSKPKRKGDWVLVHSSMVGETRTALVAADEIFHTGQKDIAVIVQLTASCQMAEKIEKPYSVGYAPFNNPLSALIMLMRWRPTAILFIEFADNYHLLFWARLFGVKTAVLNYYLSEREFIPEVKKKSERWRHRLVGTYWAQTSTYRDRLIALGVSENSVIISGPSLSTPPLSDCQRVEIQNKWASLLGGKNRSIIVAGCTRTDDEPIVIDAFKQYSVHKPDSLLVIAPRHLKYMKLLEMVLENERIEYDLRSALGLEGAKHNLVVLDTVGELRELYSIATVAFVGGSFNLTIGGHSPVEALLWGVPITMGPIYSQQEAAVEACLDAGVLTICRNADELALAWLELTDNKNMTANIKQKSAELVERYSNVFGDLYKAVLG
jgi:3-deoxy-D-manno-octulosonic-acid transferase